MYERFMVYTTPNKWPSCIAAHMLMMGKNATKCE